MLCRGRVKEIEMEEAYFKGKVFLKVKEVIQLQPFYYRKYALIAGCNESCNEVEMRCNRRGKDLKSLGNGRQKQNSHHLTIKEICQRLSLLQNTYAS